MKILMVIFAFIFCFSTMPAWAGSCEDVQACSQQTLGKDSKETGKAKLAHQCVCCHVHQTKNFGSPAMGISLTERKNIFFALADQLPGSLPTAPLLEPPAA